MESQTAVMVCLARAVADGTRAFAGFSDPTALSLLPEAARQRVQRMRAGPPRRLRERVADAMVRGRARMMVARTVAIDDAVREHPTPEVVLLGAGLDGRAWRMPELRDSVLFEIDHPDSQRAKRARLSQAAPPLQQQAREVRFAPVDFARERLDLALDAAGHEPALPTTWVWEGVVMYLTASEIEATLAVVSNRSPRGSRLIVAYFTRARMLHLVGPFVRRLGEPLRSVFSQTQMRALLARHGFAVVSDRNTHELAESLSPELGRATRAFEHLRVVVADK